MSLDLTILKLLKYKERYRRLIGAVPMNAVDQHTQVLLKDYGAFFQEFPEVVKLEAGPFLLWFKGFRHPGLKPEAVSVYESLFTTVCAEDVEPAIEQGIMERLVAADMAAKTADLIAKWSAGDEVDLYQQMRDNIAAFEQVVQRKIKNPQVMDDIETLLKDEENHKGFTFRQAELNRSIKPILNDFIILAARPDKGKTSFVSDMATFMAPQVDVVYPDEGRCILWFNNEGPGKKIVMRTWQAALGLTTEEMVALVNQKTDGPYKNKLREQYIAALGGRGGVLRIFDVHGLWNHEVEDIMSRHKPAGVIFDMVDNIQFGGAAANNGQRTDQLLEAMYQWARLMGVKHDCWVLATSQISADGDGLQFPTLPMLKDSKTGKQGAADVIITMGAVNDPTLESSRYFGCTKNKKQPTGAPKSPMAELLFDNNRSRFVGSPV